MAITVACPKCQARIEITSDLADQPIRCQRCEHTFQSADVKRHAGAIQVGAPRTTTPASDEDDEPRRPSRPHATARAPFPVTSLLILLCGMLFMLLALSIGFNVWFIAHPDFRIQEEHAAKRAREAEMMRVQAQQAAEIAARAEQAAKQQEVKLKRDLNDLERELDDVRKQLEIEKRGRGKGK